MKNSDFIDLDLLVKRLTNRKKSTDGSKVEWLKIQSIQFRKEMPKMMYYKYNVDTETEWSSVDLSKNISLRSRTLDAKPGTKVCLTQLYVQPRAVINSKKLSDLKELLQFVPPVHHEFYNTLKSGNLSDTFPDETPDESDNDDK